MQATTVAEGLGWPEGPRWHRGALWFSDMHRSRTVNTLDGRGAVSSLLQIPGNPSGLGWAPTGDLLVVSMEECRVYRVPAGSRRAESYADLSGLAREPNDMAVLPDGTAYVGDNGFRFRDETPAPGRIIRIRPGGTAQVVAEGLGLPNGIAVAPDGRRLIVAETYGGRLSQFDIHDDGNLGPRKTFFAFDDLGYVTEMAVLLTRPSAPDGICLNADGEVWVATPLRTEAVCVSPHGNIVDRVALSQTGIACMLGGPDRRTLYVTTGDLSRLEGTTGRIETVEVRTPGAGYPDATP